MKNITYSRINKSVDCLSALGEVRHRALFGGYSLSVDKVVFAMVMEDKLYLRACEDSAVYDAACSRKFLTFTKRGRFISLNYYLVDDELWCNGSLLLNLSAQSLAKARRDKTERQKHRRMRNMPNLTWSLEILLLEADIEDEKMLKALGAATAWYRLRRIRKNLSTSVLLALEGAITGVHAAIIPESRRQELLNWAKTVVEDKTHSVKRHQPDAEDDKF